MSLIKDQILVVKFFKKGELYSSRMLNALDFKEKIAVGQAPISFWGTQFEFAPNSGWELKVNGRKKALSINRKLKLNNDISFSLHKVPNLALSPSNLDQENEKIQKIQVLVKSSKNKYVHSDILENKRSQKFSFAGSKIKIKRPVTSDWEQVHKTEEGLLFFVRNIMVPSHSDIKTPVGFNPSEKELIRKIAYGYVGVIAFFLLTYAIGSFIADYFDNKNKYDVVKVDENLLQEKREKLFKEKKIVPPSTKKATKQKRVKAFKKSKKIVKGAPKKAIAKKKKTPSRAGGPKNSKVAVQGVKSNKMKITRGSKGAKGHYGQSDKTVSKLSKLSGLSQGIGFNSKSKKSASNLYAKGQGGSFSQLRKGSPNGSKDGLGVGGSGNGSHGIGSYKVGGLGTMSLGGSKRGGGTGASLSAGRTGRGYIDGISEEVVIVGGLDRSVIERIIRRNLGDINYCYERRLNARPNLAGVFEAEFFIGANGRVQRSSAKRNTVGDSRLDSCINNSIKTWQFPKPVGGTVVKVNYPFILKSS